MSETATVAVHLDDMNVVGEPVQKSAGQPFRPEHLGPFVERRGGRHQDGAPLVSPAEDAAIQRFGNLLSTGLAASPLLGDGTSTTVTAERWVPIDNSQSNYRCPYIHKIVPLLGYARK